MARRWDELRKIKPADQGPADIDLYLTFSTEHGQRVLNALFARHVVSALPENADERACWRAEGRKTLVLEILRGFEEQERVATGRSDGGNPDGAKRSGKRSVGA